MRNCKWKPAGSIIVAVLLISVVHVVHGANHICNSLTALIRLQATPSQRPVINVTEMLVPHILDQWTPESIQHCKPYSNSSEGYFAIQFPRTHAISLNKRISGPLSSVVEW